MSESIRCLSRLRYLAINNNKQAENCENEAIFKPRLLGCSESVGLDKQPNHLLALSPNEGRAWFYLFIVYLSYFYCLEVDKTVLTLGS